LKVSIVTPSYNQAEFLEQTIRSVLGQNYPDLEYIIVDGGSTDGSVEIIKKYAAKLAWWVSEPDKGQADAINKGLCRVSGEIVAWLNSDDVYAPAVIAQAVKAFEQNPDLGLVYGNAVTFDGNGHPLNDLLFDDWGLAGLVAFNIICQPAVFMRRKYLEQAEYLDESFHYLLDHNLWLRIANISKIQHISQVWAFARQHAAAKNVNEAAGFGLEAFRILDWMETQPDFAAIISADKAPVYAMANRFHARYLLDGGQAAAALKYYFRALLFHPKIALQEWHRMIFAAVSLIGLGKLGNWYYQIQRGQIPAGISGYGIDNINQLYADE
jgi:glycosyltransferase involved in cell wall biosynthesis